MLVAKLASFFWWLSSHCTQSQLELEWESLQPYLTSRLASWMYFSEERMVFTAWQARPSCHPSTCHRALGVPSHHPDQVPDSYFCETSEVMIRSRAPYRFYSRNRALFYFKKMIKKYVLVTSAGYSVQLKIVQVFLPSEVGHLVTETRAKFAVWENYLFSSQSTNGSTI